jgi:hypothetical protein
MAESNLLFSDSARYPRSINGNRAVPLYIYYVIFLGSHFTNAKARGGHPFMRCCPRLEEAPDADQTSRFSVLRIRAGPR